MDNPTTYALEKTITIMERGYEAMGTAAGISDELIRLSVGCEVFEDLRDDLNQALNRITA